MTKVICPYCKGRTEGDFLTWKYCPLCGCKIERERVSMLEVFREINKKFPEVEMTIKQESRRRP